MNELVNRYTNITTSMGNTCSLGSSALYLHPHQLSDDQRRQGINIVKNYIQGHKLLSFHNYSLNIPFQFCELNTNIHKYSADVCGFAAAALQELGCMTPFTIAWTDNKYVISFIQNYAHAAIPQLTQREPHSVETQTKRKIKTKIRGIIGKGNTASSKAKHRYDSDKENDIENLHINIGGNGNGNGNANDIDDVLFASVNIE